ncbi:unnamed protein product, partial [Iphiclides podalirius]
MQALGLSGQHGQTAVAGGGGQAQGGSMPLGMGGLPVNQALVAAALNQAGWGLINNIPSGGSEQGAFAGPASSAPPAPPNFLSWMQQECRTYPGPVTGIKHRPVSMSHPVTNTLLTSYDATLNMYDDETQTQERAFHSSGKRNVIDGHKSRIFACTFNPRSNHELVSGGWDDAVICWDARQPFATRYFLGVHLCGEGLDFDKPGKQILTCSWQDNDNIQIWDYGSCKLIETIVPDNHQSKLYCGKFVPKTNLIVCGGSDGNILRVVDVKLKLTECSIKYNPGAIYAFDYGTVRRKPKNVSETYKRVNELQSVPRVAFVSGKKLQIVDFG